MQLLKPADADPAVTAGRIDTIQYTALNDPCEQNVASTMLGRHYAQTVSTQTVVQFS